MPHADDEVIAWLVDPEQSDPAVRWQVQRDLLGAPEAQWRAERDRVEHEGWGAQLLAAQDDDGQWAGGSFAPADFDWSTRETQGQPWTASSWAVGDLRRLGLDPASASARRTVDLLDRNAVWFDDAAYRFWGGETEECINGRLITDGTWFGVDMTPVVDKVLPWQMADGGWNCEWWRENGATVSSFASTLNVVEGLLAHELAHGPDGLRVAQARRARLAGEDYLLQRRLHRSLRTGDVVDPDYLRPARPARWSYDVLRALEHFRVADRRDERLADAVEQVRAMRQPEGRWLLGRTLPGRAWLPQEDGAGQPSRWVTLEALRVLRWWDAG